MAASQASARNTGARTQAAQNNKTTPDASASDDRQNGQSQQTGAAAAEAKQNTQVDAAALLKADHRKVEQIFEQYEKSDDEQEKARLAKQVCKELIVHTKLEEEIFYPACREKNVTDDLLDEAQVEHDGAKTLIAELIEGSPDDEFYDAKVTVLSEHIKHHVGEEEQPRTGIFAKAKAAGVDMSGVGQKLQARKQKLVAENDENNLEPPQPRSVGVVKAAGLGIPRAMPKRRASAAVHRAAVTMTMTMGVAADAAVKGRGGMAIRKVIPKHRKEAGKTVRPLHAVDIPPAAGIMIMTTGAAAAEAIAVRDGTGIPKGTPRRPSEDGRVGLHRAAALLRGVGTMTMTTGATAVAAVAMAAGSATRAAIRKRRAAAGKTANFNCSLSIAGSHPLSAIFFV